jgi:hypothetical protein
MDVHTDRVDFGAGQQSPPKAQAQNITRETNPKQDGGTLNIPANVRATAPGENVSNPLNEETIRCRVREGAEFFAQFNNGNIVRAGEEYDVPISQARAASMYLDDISSGQPKAIPHERQVLNTDIPRAELAGRPRHERIGALEDEIKRLDERRGQVQKQLDHEKAQLAQSQQTQQQQPPQQAQPAKDEPVRTEVVGDKNEPAQVKSDVRT